MNLWLVKTLKGNHYSNCHINGTDVLHIESDLTKYCAVPIENNAYIKFVILAINVFGGQLILTCIVDKLGRKIALSTYQV